MPEVTLPRLKLEPLSAEAFAPFGVVIELDRHQPLTINEGHAQKFADLLPHDCQHQDGRVAVHFYRSRGRKLPIEIRALERHPLGSQAFWPLHDRPYAIVVAPPGDAPDPAAIRAFVARGDQAIQYHRGTWHHYQIALETDSEFLVFDREGPGENCDEVTLAQPLLLAR